MRHVQIKASDPSSSLFIDTLQAHGGRAEARSEVREWERG